MLGEGVRVQKALHQKVSQVDILVHITNILLEQRVYRICRLLFIADVRKVGFN